MTRKEANEKLNQACNLIFDIEKELPCGEIPRLYGYRARIEVGKLQDGLRATQTESDISKVAI